jgi:hypothetical protein
LLSFLIPDGKDSQGFEEGKYDQIGYAGMQRDDQANEKCAWEEASKIAL